MMIDGKSPFLNEPLHFKFYILLTSLFGRRITAFVAICYRIAGHVKYAAKQGESAQQPRYLGVGVFYCLIRHGDEDDELEQTHQGYPRRHAA